jgi:hypothetical protein
VSGKAVTALILGIGGLTFFPFVLSVFALVLGIAVSGGHQHGASQIPPG